MLPGPHCLYLGSPDPRSLDRHGRSGIRSQIANAKAAFRIWEILPRFAKTEISEVQKRMRICLVWVQKSLPPESLFWDFGGPSDPPPPRKDFNSFTISTFLVIAGDPEITRIVEISLDRGPFQESLDPPKSQKRVQVLNPEKANLWSLLHSRKSQFSQIGCNARGPPSDPSRIWCC